jgi:hypothetical protein
MEALARLPALTPTSVAQPQRSSAALAGRKPMRRALVVLAVCASVTAFADEQEKARPPTAEEQQQVQQRVQQQMQASPFALQPMLVQGVVQRSKGNQLVLSTPLSKGDRLTIRVDQNTEVLPPEAGVSVKDLREGQLIRAALVPMGEGLRAIAIEVVPQAEREAQEPAQQPSKPEPGAQPDRPQRQPQ